MELPVVQGISSFQGKCKIVQDSFFLANIALPLARTDDFPLSTTKDLSDTMKLVTTAELKHLFKQSKTDSALDFDIIM